MRCAATSPLLSQLKQHNDNNTTTGNKNSSNEEPAAIAPDAPRPSPEEIKREVLDVARRLAARGIQLLVIDTEDRYLGQGFAAEVAEAGNGRHYAIPNAGDRAIAAAAREWMR